MNDKPVAKFPFLNCSGHDVIIEKVVCNNCDGKSLFTLKNRIFDMDPIQPSTFDTLYFERVYWNEFEPGLYDVSYTIHFKDSPVQQHINIFIELMNNTGSLESSKVKVETVNRGETALFSAKVYNSGSTAVRIKSKYKTHGTVTCLSKVPLKIGPKEEVVLDFEIETEGLLNYYQGKYVFETNEDGKWPKLEIAYEGELISEGQASIKFDSLVMTAHRLKGEALTYEFWYENNGDEPLIISTCKGSCGCVVPSCSKEPLMPGERDVIKVKYDTKRVGPINKSVTVSTNAAQQSIVLRIKGMVTDPDFERN